MISLDTRVLMNWGTLGGSASIAMALLPVIEEHSSLKCPFHPTKFCRTDSFALPLNHHQDHQEEDTTSNETDDTTEEEQRCQSPPPLPVTRSVCVHKSCLKHSPTTTTTNKKKCVQFGTISIRRHAITLGDHPGCRQGVPITLDWEYVQQPTIELTEYEEMRGDIRRKLKAMYLNKEKRKALLANAGFDASSLTKAKKETKLIQRARKISTFLSPAELILHTLQKKVVVVK